MADWLLRHVFTSLGPDGIDRPLIGTPTVDVWSNPWIRGILHVGGFKIENPRDDDWELCFDTGIGMTPEQIDRFCANLEDDNIRRELNGAIDMIASCSPIPKNRSIFRS